MSFHQKSYYLTLGLLYSLFGLILFLFPGGSLRFLVSAIGLILLIAGLLKLISALWLRRRFGKGVFGGSLFSGFVLLFLGLYARTAPERVASLIPIFFGASLLIDSIGKFQFAASMRTLRATGYWASFLYALMTALIGVFFLLDPFGVASITVMCFGLALLANGIGELVVAFRLPH